MKGKQMLKKVLWGSLALALVVGFSAPGFSSDKGNHRKGKYVFKKNCRSCHNDSGSAVSLSPDSKTQAQWTRTFKPKKYKKLACKDEWEKLSEKELNDIFSYLHKYAFDSPSPAKCK